MRWPRFFRRRYWDEERAREIEAYLQIETDENIARGMTLDDARYAARRKLGNPTRIREEIYRMNSAGFMETLWQDLRYALRQLRRSPGFTGAAVLSLGLGIGANTAIFTLLDQLVLRLLPVKDPGRLVLLNWEGYAYGPNMSGDVLSYPLYRDLRDQSQAFSGLLCYHRTNFGVSYAGQVEQVQGELVSGNYFDVFGVPAALGRTFSSADDLTPGGHPVAVLSYDYWVDRFHADPGILGQGITINGFPFTVVGVSARGFEGVEVGWSPKVRVPMMMRNQVTAAAWTAMFGLDTRRGRWVRVFGRLKPGVSADQAKASLQPLFHSILEMETQQKEFVRASAETRREFLKSWISVTPASRGRSNVREQYQTPLRMLMAMVGLVLLIACANVANLLLARATGRQREIAVRLALGAGRGRIVRQSLVESILLAFLGGGAGLLLALWTDHLLLGLLAAGDVPLALSAAPDWRILGFTLAVSTITGLLFGLAPALGATRVHVALALKEQAAALAGGAQTRLRQLLVVSQAAVSVLLLIAAGLFLRSLLNLRTLDPGFQTGNVIAFSIDPTLNGYSAERRSRLFLDVLQRLRAAPGVESAGFGIVRVLDDDWWCSAVTLEGYRPKPGEPANACSNGVSPGYIATLRIPLVSGRDFSAADGSSKRKVALVNESFVRTYLGGEPALGRYLGYGDDPGTKTDIEIVGVVKDSKYSNMRDATPRQILVDSEQMDGVLHGTVYIRTAMDARQAFSTIRRVVRDADPGLPVLEMRTLDRQLDLILTTERLVASLASVFALLATALAAIGLYGVMAFNVARRTREIGIRMALGARSGNVTWLVMREVLLLVTVGTAVALPAAWGLTQLVKSQLYNIESHDPLTIIAATLLLTLVAAIAGYIPARRATRIDPIRALRYE